MSSLLLNFLGLSERYGEGFQKIAVLTAALLGVLALPLSYPFGIQGGSQVACAQIGEGSEIPQQHRQGPTDLPEWAEPRERENRSADLGQRRKRKVQINNCSQPGCPPAGNRNVPLGGLEWLILAGAGYGFFKLRKDDGHSPSSN